MVAAGLFRNHRIELLYGRLVTVSPQHAPHASTVQRLNKWLVTALGDRADVRVQLPFAAGDESEPEPDVAVVHVGDYDDSHPSEAYLIVEVSDSSLDDDRRLKRPIYAAARVPEYWIVNLVSRCVEIYRPSTPKPRVINPSDDLVVPGFEDVRMRVEAVLPRVG